MSFLSTIEKYGAAMYFLAFTQRGCLHETRHEIYRDEISTHHKRSFVYITFHCGWNEVKFRFRGGERARGGGSGPRKTVHQVKANYFCFDELNACAVVLFHMISFRVVFTWYFIPRNEISFLSKWRQWNITNNKFHFGLYQVWKIDQTPK